MAGLAEVQQPSSAFSKPGQLGGAHGALGRSPWAAPETQTSQDRDFLGGAVVPSSLIYGGGTPACSSTHAGASSPPSSSSSDAQTSSCPIPIADWRESDNSVRAAQRQGGEGGRRSSESACRPPHLRESLLRASSTPCDLPPQPSAAPRRRSLSSLGPQQPGHVANRQLQQHLQQQLKEQMPQADRQWYGDIQSRRGSSEPGSLHNSGKLEALGSAPGSQHDSGVLGNPPGSQHNSGVLGPAGSLPGSQHNSGKLEGSGSRPNSGRLEAMGAPWPDMDAAGSELEDAELAFASSKIECLNLTDVLELCADMEVAGMRVEDVDIMCVPHCALGLPRVDLGTDYVLMSVKFEGMTLRHYPGDRQTKALFHSIFN